MTWGCVSSPVGRATGRQRVAEAERVASCTRASIQRAIAGCGVSGSPAYTERVPRMSLGTLSRLTLPLEDEARGAAVHVDRGGARRRERGLAR